MLLLAQIPTWMTGILIALFLFVCLLMILVVLIQRPAGGGLSGAFGSGAGSGQTAFGAKTGDALTIATVAVFFLYLLFAVGLNFAARPGDGPAAGPPPAAAPAPGGAAPTIPQPAPIGGDMEDRPPATAVPPAPTGLPLEPEAPTPALPPEPGAP
jgi:preprotein translocase subunit SecG